MTSQNQQEWHRHQRYERLSQEQENATMTPTELRTLIAQDVRLFADRIADWEPDHTLVHTGHTLAADMMRGPTDNWEHDANTYIADAQHVMRQYRTHCPLN